MSDSRAEWGGPAHPGLEGKLVLTYNNTALTDGVGSQLQRIYGIWAISRLLGVAYLHSPIVRVDYQGLSALEADSADPDFPLEFNELFHIESDPVRTDDLHVMNLRNIHPRQVRLLGALVDRGATRGKPGLVRLVVPYGVADKFPDCYAACKAISPFPAATHNRSPLRVAIHVRRGEQVAFRSDRLLPNSYYISAGRNVARTLEALELDYELELWTEVPTREVTVHPGDHGISERISGPVVITPEMNRLDDFSVLPNLVHRINGRTIDCLRGLATADILIMSKSSFSYIAGVLNRQGIVMYHPFWHPAPSWWMTVGPDGGFDSSQLARAVTALRS